MAFDNTIYKDYIKEIEERKKQGLNPKPIDGAELLSEIIAQIKDVRITNIREDSLQFFIYNTITRNHKCGGCESKVFKRNCSG
jgi:aconitate hydratase 2/2-methylisocitrate dehydratase